MRVEERESRTHVSMQRSMNGTIAVPPAKSSEAPSLCRGQAEELLSAMAAGPTSPAPRSPQVGVGLFPKLCNGEPGQSLEQPKWIFS